MHAFKSYEYRDICAKNYEHLFKLVLVMEENLADILRHVGQHSLKMQNHVRRQRLRASN